MLHLLLFLVLVSVSSTDEAPKIPDGYKKCPVPTRYNSGGWLKSTELCPKMNHSCMAVLASGGKFKDGGCMLNLNYSFYHPNKTVYDAHDWKKACDKSTGIHTLWTEMDGTLRVKVCCNETCPLNPFDWKDTLQNPWLPYVVGIIGGLISSGYTLSFTHTCYVKCRAKKVVLKAKRRRSKKPKKCEKKPGRSQSPPR